MRNPSILSLWVKDGTTTPQSEITSPGTWELVNNAQLDRSTPSRITFRKGSGNDPVGATATAGIKTGTLTPEPISGASMTLPTLATTTASLPVRVYPDGRVCLTVTSLPAGGTIIAEVIQ